MSPPRDVDDELIRTSEELAGYLENELNARPVDAGMTLTHISGRMLRVSLTGARPARVDKHFLIIIKGV